MSFMERLVAWRDDLDGDFVVEAEANKFIDMMVLEHPSELDEWLKTHAVSFCSRALNRIEKVRRDQVLRPSRRQEFAAAEQDGDVSIFVSVSHPINSNKQRRPLGEMTGTDHKFVAQMYKEKGNRHLFLAVCHQAVAKKIGNRRTADVLTEEQYKAIFDENTPKAPEEPALVAAA